MLARITLIALVSMSALSTDMYLSGIPAMIRELDATHAGGQLTLGLFMLGLAVGQLVFGPLSDYFGRKPVVTVGLFLYVAASVFCTIATSIELLWLARMLQGASAASGPVIARAMVRDRYSGVDAARMMALLAGSMAVVPLLAPVLGSWLLNWFSWRVQFVCMGLFAIAVLLGIKTLKESCPSIGIGRLQLGSVISQFGVFMSSARVVGYSLCGASMFAAAFTYIASAPFLVIEVLGFDETLFGYTFMASVSGYMIGSLASSQLVVRLDSDRVIALGVLVCVCACLLMLALSLGDSFTLTGLLVAAFLSLVGAGLVMPNAQMGAISAFPLAAGGASAAFGFVQVAAGGLSSVLVGRLYDGTLLPIACIMAGAVTLGVFGFLLVRRGVT